MQAEVCYALRMFKYENILQSQIDDLKRELPGWGFQIVSQPTPGAFQISGHGITGDALYDSEYGCLTIDNIKREGIAARLMPDSFIDGQIRRALGIS